MQKRLAHLIVYVFLCSISFAQQPPVTFTPDSAWYAGYFDRLTTMREYRQPAAYDSLELVRNIAETAGYMQALSSYHFHKATWHIAHKNIDSAVSHFKAWDPLESTCRHASLSIL